MGLGGYLCWTAVARELRKRLNPEVKIMPVEQHGVFLKTIKHPIFHNNDDFLQEWENSKFYFPMILNNPESNYCKRDTPERAIHKYDKHIIEQYCEVYGIQNPELKCKLILDDSEKKSINTLLKNISGNFVTIDIGINKNYNQNKFENFNVWQDVVNKLSKDINVVQVGLTQQILNNVIDFTNKTTFREAAGIVGKSKLFIGSEGGMVHAATAFNVNSVAIMTSFTHPTLVRYPGSEYIWLNNDNHGPCGMKIKCEKCHNNMKILNSQDIIKRIYNKL